MGAAKEDTHKPLFQDCASSSTSLYILAVAPSVIPPLLSSPLLSSPVQLLWPVFTLLEREREREREREGPERGQCRLSERPSTPRLSKEVCMGAGQHPFHKLHSHPPLSFTHTFAYRAGMHTQTTPRSFPPLHLCLTFPTNPPPGSRGHLEDVVEIPLLQSKIHTL